MLPLLHLPRLVFDNVYKFLKVGDIVLLSLCSKRMKIRLQSQKASKSKLNFTVYVNPDQSIISLTKKNEDQLPLKLFSWTLSQKWDYALTEAAQFQDWKIDHEVWRVAKHGSGWLSAPETEFMERDLLTIVVLLQNLFQILINTMSFNFQSCLRFDKLFKETPVLHRAKSVEIGSNSVFPEEMDFMLEHFATESLTIDGYAGRKYSYQGPLNFSSVLFYCATWVTPEAFWTLASTCKQIELESAILITDNVLNKFIKDWMAGDNRTLEVVKVSRQISPIISLHSDPPTPLEAPVILEGIQSTPGTRKRLSAAKYTQKYYRYENGVDIRRADGLLATVLLVEEIFMKQFVFTVWYDPLPNLQ